MIEIGIACVQAILLVLLAPLFSGSARWFRAKMHTRRGPSILQDYYDLIKLFRRQDLRTADSSFVVRIMPPLFLGSMMLLAAGIPMVAQASPIPALGDIITIIYLMSLPRFFFALAGVDSSNAYAGVGGIRELIIGVLVEPSMMMALFVAALACATTNVGLMSQAVAQGTVLSPVGMGIAGIAFAMACYIELGKLPFDAAEAEQEIQEGPLQEYSGISLAMIKVSMSMKQVLVISWFVAIFLPFGAAGDLSIVSLALGALFFLIKIAVIGLLCAVFENVVSRVRWKLVGRQTWTVVGVSAMALVFCVLGI